MNVLQVENLIRSYRKSVIKESEEDVKVLKGISFQVAEGEFVGIMGKCGIEPFAFLGLLPQQPIRFQKFTPHFFKGST